MMASLGQTSSESVNSLWPSDAIWRQRSGSTLVQIMACCLTAPSHYLNQCWLIISKVQWHPSESNFTRDTSAITCISHWNNAWKLFVENFVQISKGPMRKRRQFIIIEPVDVPAPLGAGPFAGGLLANIYSSLLYMSEYAPEPSSVPFGARPLRWQWWLQICNW